MSQETGYGETLLRRIVDEAQSALTISDPVERMRIIAGLIQPYAGWALRWVIEDARLAGQSWPAISRAVGMTHPTVLRQWQAGGPVIVARPFHSPGTRNDHGQTPLRLAATSLVHRTIALAMMDHDTATNAYLFEPVNAMATAQVRQEPQPLHNAVHAVLTQADAIPAHHRTVPDAMSRWERDVWNALDALRDAFERDCVSK